MNRAVIYARVSSKDQETEGFSIPAQLKLLHEYAAKNGYQIVQEFIDIQTAKKMGRVRFNNMLNFIKENPSIKHILVEKTDRLTRNMFDYLEVYSLTLKTDVAIHLIKENGILRRGSRSSEKFIFGVQALVSQNQIDNLSEEVIKGMREKAIQGTYPSWAPYGYLNARVNGKKIIVIDPDTAPFVKKMFELYATGSYSLLNLRKKMQADGMIYKNGKNFYTSKVETILKNEFYTGAFIWKGKKYDNASHEPIVSRELFQKVQSIMRNPYKNKSRKGLFPYANLIRCGICGCSLTSEYKKNKYIYYRCTGYKGNCHQKYLKQEALEKQFENVLADIAIPEQIQELILQNLRSNLQDKIEYHNKLVEQAERHIKILQNRIDQAYIDKIDKKISEEFWQSRAPGWMQEKEDLTIKLLSMQKADTHYLENANLVLELSRKAIGLFKQQNSDQKRKLIDILVSNCSYKDEKVDVELKPAFQMMLKSRESRNWCAR